MNAYDLNKTARWTFYTAGILLVLLGFLAFLNPWGILASASIFMGIGFLLAGLNNLVPYFSMRGNPLRPKWLLPLGVVDILFGVFFLSHLGLAMFTLTTLLGIWMLLTGLVRVYMAFQLKTAGVKKWWLALADAVAFLVIAALLLANPLAAALGIGLLSGLALIGTGALTIFEARTLYPPRFGK